MGIAPWGWRRSRSKGREQGKGSDDGDGERGQRDKEIKRYIYPLYPSPFTYRRNPLRCKHKRRGLLGNDQPPAPTLGERGGWMMGLARVGNGGGGPPRVAARIIYIPLPDFFAAMGPRFTSSLGVVRVGAS